MSVQLTRYLRLRGSGATIEAAAEQVGFGVMEARLTEKAVESGELSFEQPGEETAMSDDVKTSIRVGDGPYVEIDLEKGIDHPENSAAKEQMGEFVGKISRDMHKPANHSGDKLRLFIERIERIEEEKKGLSTDIADVLTEAKGTGFDTKTIKRIIKLRKMSTHERQEAEALLETYMSAVGMTPIEAAIALAAAA